jgi:acetoin utilization protein AcuB
MNIPVEEFTSPVLVTIGPEATIDEALELMQENSIRHLPVVKGENTLGIVSERDLLLHMGKNWSEMVKVGDVMNTSILSVYGNDNLGDVAFQLSSQKVGSALVLDNEGKLYGIFTTTDALNALVEILFPELSGQSPLAEL